MFQPSYFKQSDKKKMLEFIRKHSFASIVTMSSLGLVGNHIPMLVIEREGNYFLQGHVAKANAIHKDIDTTVDALAMFHGPDAYISPSWYPSKKKDPRTVPTWNYVVVHVSGAIIFFQDKQWLRGHLTNLSKTHEKRVGESWKISDAPVAYLDKMFGAIVGIEIEIKSITGTTKMSQNHPIENQKGVVERLNNLGLKDVVGWIGGEKS